MDGLIATLVVEADVATDHRDSEGATCVSHAFNALFKLEVDLRSLRVAKVQAVRQSNGLRTHARHVATCLRDYKLAAHVRVEIDHSTIAIGGDCNALPGG